MVDSTEVTAGATGNTGVTDTGAASATVVEPKGDGQPSIADIMGFDPFAPPKKDAAGNDIKPEIKSEVKPEVKPEQKLGADGKPIPVAAPMEVKPAPVPAIDTKPLEQLIREQTATIQESLKKSEPAAADKPPRFQLGVPEQLVNALASEDPKERGIALNAVISGVANHVWTAVEEMVQSNIARLAEGLPNVIAAHSSYSETQKQVASDFFGTYKMFEDKAFAPVLQHAAMQVAQSWQTAQKPIAWNAEFRDAVAENMFTRFPMLRPAADAAAAAAAAGGGERKTPFVTGGGSRQPAQAVNEFEQVLSST